MAAMDRTNRQIAEQEAMNMGVGVLKLAGENIEIYDKHLIVY